MMGETLLHNYVKSQIAVKVDMSGLYKSGRIWFLKDIPVKESDQSSSLDEHGYRRAAYLILGSILALKA